MATDKLTKESDDSLVGAALAGNAVRFQEIFSQALNIRVRDSIEEMTPEVAKGVFNSEAEAND